MSCDVCSGEGGWQTEDHWQKCGECHGRGYLLDECVYCDGTGYSEGEVCEECDGTGERY